MDQERKEIMLSFPKEMIRRYKEPILYVVFGGLTTLVNIISYFLLTRFAQTDTVPATVIAWILSVLFAYITNKIWVFESKSHRWKDLIREIVLFFGCRALSGVLDVFLMWLFVDVLSWYDVLIKIISNIVVIILNYLFSKLLIFRKSKNKQADNKR
jgi:putative flippase GtrA